MRLLSLQTQNVYRSFLGDEVLKEAVLKGGTKFAELPKELPNELVNDTPQTFCVKTEVGTSAPQAG